MKQAERQKTLKAARHYFYQDNTRSGSHCRYSLQYLLGLDSEVPPKLPGR